MPGRFYSGLRTDKRIFHQASHPILALLGAETAGRRAPLSPALARRIRSAKAGPERSSPQVGTIGVGVIDGGYNDASWR